uniref:Uncharacterized protein n=1 Tax=Ananas comosus var. bracteatus TaxID=296719 RepID=A0A6V7P9Q1_ANACO|nr:unnamed protein product [Ananas comosus var. bracteatus]
MEEQRPMAAPREQSGRPKCYSLSRHHLTRLAEPLRETLARTPYAPPEGVSVSVKSLLESLLSSADESSADGFCKAINDLFLCCAAVAAAEGDESPTLYWIPKELSLAARSVLKGLSEAASYGSENEMVAEMMPELVPLVKG